LSYFDIFCGKDILEHYCKRPAPDYNIHQYDTMLSFSMDGAQLYRNKKSDVLIANWVLLNLDPKSRYKKTEAMPAFVVPGPEKVKHPDSFMYPSWREVRILMDHGLKIRNGALPVPNQLQTSHLHLLLTLADAVAMAQILGTVGHIGDRSCRENCPTKGRLMPTGSTYYPCLHKPDGYARPKGNHPSSDPADVAAYEMSREEYLNDLNRVLRSTTQGRFEHNRRAAGLVKPSLLCALPDLYSLGAPQAHVADWMHLPTINAQEEMIELWRGTFDCYKTDNVNDWPWAGLKEEDKWEDHGAEIESLGMHYASWFGRVPRNPAKKLNTGFKAIEGALYMYGSGPMAFRSCLPELYYRHFCMLVCIYDILEQLEITHADLAELTHLTIRFAKEFERIYVQNHPDRVHMIRPWIHTLLHTAQGVVRTGPLIYYAQWTMERLIGLLEDDLHLHSNPYANIAHIAKRLCSRNALKALIPDLNIAERHLTDADVDCGGGLALLHPRDRVEKRLPEIQADAVRAFAASLWDNEHEYPQLKMVRYARAALPNGCIVWSPLSAYKVKKTGRMVEVRSMH
jgi:hypothetical protein